MGWERWKERGQQFLREIFYIITLSLLSLIFPLSFLLLARLANAHYILSFTSPPFSSLPFSSLFPLSFLYNNPTYPTLLHLLVSIVSFTALLRALMGSTTPTTTTTPTSEAYLYAAWTLLCMFDVCVVLGIERTIASGFWPLNLDGVGISRGRCTNLMIRVVFFIGMHETMLHWSRFTVRPVVDDTVLRVVREERLVERVVMAASFGGLWWWGLRKEVEAMVVIFQVKRKLLNVELVDFVNCWLYYLTLTIALVRLSRGLVWLAKLKLCTRLRRSSSQSGSSSDDSKV